MSKVPDLRKSPLAHAESKERASVGVDEVRLALAGFEHQRVCLLGLLQIASAESEETVPHRDLGGGKPRASLGCDAVEAVFVTLEPCAITASEAQQSALAKQVLLVAVDIGELSQAANGLFEVAENAEVGFDRRQVGQHEALRSKGFTQLEGLSCFAHSSNRLLGADFGCATGTFVDRFVVRQHRRKLCSSGGVFGRCCIECVDESGLRNGVDAARGRKSCNRPRRVPKHLGVANGQRRVMESCSSPSASIEVTAW